LRRRKATLRISKAPLWISTAALLTSKGVVLIHKTSRLLNFIPFSIQLINNYQSGRANRVKKPAVKNHVA
jgi:hypothetical protein